MDKNEVLRQMIAEKERQIELYQAMVAEWRRELGEVATPFVNGAATPVTTKVDKKQQAGDVISLVRDWQFFNKSQPEAAKALLEMVAHPLTTQQIIDAIEKGGVKVGGKTPKDKKQNFYTILARSKEIGRAARGTWGLMTWPGIFRAGEKEAEPDAAEKDSE